MKMKSCCLVAIFLFLVSTASGQARSDDWAQWRGPSQDGHAISKDYFDSNGFKLDLVWQKHFGAGYASISVSKGKLLVSFAEGQSDWMGAFDANSGKQIWRKRIGKKYPAHDGGHDGPLSTPISDGKTVFTLGPWGTLFAFDLEDGTPKWQVDLVKDFRARAPFWGFCTTPTLTADSVIVQVSGRGENGIISFDKTNGKVNWKQPAGSTDYRSPVQAKVNGQTQIVCCTNYETSGHDPKTGRKVWSKRSGSRHEMTPVPVGDNQILVMDRSGTEMIRISSVGIATRVWRSSELRSYGTPVYHDGYLYGFSGNILTCVDSKTGKRVWRSREPGGKAMILVDDHLVIFGSKGDVVAVEATHEGYREKSRISVSAADGYASPIFASGMIFARDLTGKIFAIKAVKSASVAKNEIKVRNKFDEFLVQLRKSKDQKASIDAFLAKQKSFPIVEDNRWVHFVYRGSVEDVAIQGTMLHGGESDSLKRFDKTDLFYRSYEIKPGSRWEYQLIVDFDAYIPDPRNKQTAYRRGQWSELVLDGWKEPEWTKRYRGQNKGDVENIGYEGGTATVFLPHGYKSSDKRYPSVIITDGDEWLSRGDARQVLNHLFEEQTEPAIIVFASANQSRALGGGQTRQFAKSVAENLIKVVDSRFRTIKKRESRIVMGKRGAAVAAVYTALRYPEVFGHCIAISYGRADTVRKDSIAALISKDKKVKPNLYLTWNHYEVSRPLSFDCREQSIELKKLLQANDYPVLGIERTDSSSWRSWRIMFGEALIEKIGKKEQ